MSEKEFFGKIGKITLKYIYIISNLILIIKNYLIIFIYFIGINYFLIKLNYYLIKPKLKDASTQIPDKYEPYSLEYYEAKKRWDSFQKIQKYKKQTIEFKKLSCT